MSLASTFTNIGNAINSVTGIFGRPNASQLSDCIGAAGQYGSAQALAMYPQCAPYASQMNVPIGTPNPRIPGTSVAPPPMVVPQLPQAMPGGSTYVQTPMAATLPAVYGQTTPAMTVLPKIMPQAGALAGAAGTAIAGAAGVLTAAARKALPVLNKNLALASGLTVVGSLVYTAAGLLVGRTRKRKRMNPLNYRAAKRAARRLCAVRDLCGQIDKAIPSKPRRSRRPVYAFQRKRKTCR